MKYLSSDPIPFAMPDTTEVFGKQTCNECVNNKGKCSKGRNMEKYKDGVVKCFEWKNKNEN